MNVMREAICQKCEHNEVVRAEATDFADANYDYPMAVAYAPGIMWGKSIRKPYGKLFTYTCCRCGFTEWYAENPSQIPIGKQFNTVLIQGS
jgi:predicted nucleic-acid-binding Zn-ribbon protein